jgi:hypothetical protein
MFHLRTNCSRVNFYCFTSILLLFQQLGWCPRICSAELTTLIYIATIKNSIIFISLLYWISKFTLILLFQFSYFNFYVDCIHSGIMVVYKLIF